MRFKDTRRILGESFLFEADDKYNRTASITFEITDEESRENGDAKDRGFSDEDFTVVDSDDVELVMNKDIAEATPEEITDGIVKATVNYMNKKGFTMPSASGYDSRVWYSTSEPDIDYKTGEETIESFHLGKNYTEDEKKKIFAKISGKELKEETIDEAVNIDKQIEKIASMTDENYHQEAKLELAKILGNKKAENILKHIIAIHEIEGSLPSELSTYSSNILKDLLKDAKEKFDAETYSKLHGAF